MFIIMKPNFSVEYDIVLLWECNSSFYNFLDPWKEPALYLFYEQNVKSGFMVPSAYFYYILLTGCDVSV